MNKTEDKEVAAADRLVADESLEDTDLTESKPIKTNIMSITQRIILGLALIGAFLGVLDTSIVYTGTVKMAAQLQLNANALSWVQVAYALTYAGFMLVGGKLGDIYGRKPLFIASLIIFGIGSLVVGAATNAPIMIGFRAIQGIGAAVLAPNCLALLTDTFQGKARQRAIGYYASVIGAGAAVGLVIGGFFATFASWRVGFYINGPIALLMVIIAARYLPSAKRQTGKIDWIGTILSVLAMTSISYGLDGSPWPVMTLLISLVLWGAFIISQGRVAHPTMPLEIFTDKERMASYVSSLLFSAAAIGFWFYTPQFMQKALGLTPFMTALGMVPMAILLFIVAVRARTFVDRWHNSSVMLFGFVVVSLSLAELVVVSRFANYWLLLLGTLGFAVGFALAFATLATSGLARIRPQISGAASGVYNTARQFGGALGLAVFAATTGRLTNIADVFGQAMLIGVGMTLVGIVLVLTLIIPAEKRSA
ncbi:MFS transporter [Lacticaseibacillus casei]|uniref:MFS transporter n=1 Tax=Lacticaseibacillus huelsenbergensis TaxID=3035291 RepID=A0ABY8DXL4_9LACO|nr:MULTISPECIES: MFS transporter [Lacticaseibacillus]MDG3061430.1 MFS transporter [Lacticaseibacillus sp. BCRC 81376]QVI37023.1 MFS transporter [Lacticaseibacillus casei]QXG58816.1 MFS transporter [Lacticaseibacillus casei]WFB39743.1 MFS transporter [Lacticaseibacillus huelsenbergensis]WFB41443.1 MFS transporter [Lacticaseibacillus huelsenbergensis]